MDRSQQGDLSEDLMEMAVSLEGWYRKVERSEKGKHNKEKIQNIFCQLSKHWGKTSFHVRYK